MSVNRIHFANQLRGIAAFAVVWHHLAFQYATGSGYAAGYVGMKAPPSDAASPLWTQATSTLLNFGSARQWWDLGEFGVALFFLISGFVIPFSIERLSRVEFTVARAIRIYSVYIVGVFFLYLWSGPIAAHAGEPSRSNIPLLYWLAQATLTPIYFSTPLLDSVSWTLLVELQFYLLCVLLAGTIKAARIGSFALLPVVLVIAVCLLKTGAIQAVSATFGLASAPWVVQQVVTQFAFACFMLLGYLFWLHWKGALTTTQLLLYGLYFTCAELTIFGMFGLEHPVLLRIAASQVVAVAVFAAAYINRDKFKPIFVLDRLAAVSYPLYCTHLLVGWTVLVIWHRSFGQSLVGLVAAIGASLGVAYLVHVWVERPSINFTSFVLARKRRSG